MIFSRSAEPDKGVLSAEQVNGVLAATAAELFIGVKAASSSAELGKEVLTKRSLATEGESSTDEPEPSEKPAESEGVLAAVLVPGDPAIGEQAEPDGVLAVLAKEDPKAELLRAVCVSFQLSIVQ